MSNPNETPYRDGHRDGSNGSPPPQRRHDEPMDRFNERERGYDSGKKGGA